jgi:hypothetical protein
VIARPLLRDHEIVFPPERARPRNGKSISRTCASPSRRTGRPSLGAARP